MAWPGACRSRVGRWFSDDDSGGGCGCRIRRPPYMRVRLGAEVVETIGADLANVRSELGRVRPATDHDEGPGHAEVAEGVNAVAFAVGTEVDALQNELETLMAAIKDVGRAFQEADSGLAQEFEKS